jgi:hypothetical protein
MTAAEPAGRPTARSDSACNRRHAQAAAQFDEEEDAEALQPDRLDGKEIDREHALPMRLHELTPRHPAACAARSETLVS